MRSWALCAYANQRFALAEQSALARLNASIQTWLRPDYVACGSNRRAVVDRILDGPTSRNKKATRLGGVSAGGAC